MMNCLANASFVTRWLLPDEARLKTDQLTEAESTYADVRGVFHDQSDVICRQRILRLAQEHKLTSYDAAYLELTDRLRAPLTNNGDLSKAAKKEKVETVLHS